MIWRAFWPDHFKPERNRFVPSAATDRRRAAQRVRVALDAQMLARDPLNFHPLHNEATTTISKDGFLKFLTLTGHQPVLVDFDRLEALECARQAAQ